MHQIVCLGSPYIENCLKEELKSYNDIQFVDYGDFIKEPNNLVLYFGDDNSDKRCDSIPLNEFVDKGMILPVIRESLKFKNYIPDELEAINAIIIPSENEVSRLKNRILEWFGYIEVNRKVFISYKRNDSLNLAQQLYDSLIKLHYTPFLDSYSIDSGVDFQEYLLHELSDSAIFLFINTPNYEFSKFTMEELNVANLLQIGTVELRSNNVNKYKEAEFAKVYELNNDIKPDTVFPENTIKDIIYLIEKTRAELFEFRQNALIDQIKAKSNDDSIEPDIKGVVYSKQNDSWYYPIIHTPDSTDYKKAIDQIGVVENKNKYLVYNGLHCRKDIKEHIIWLNQSLPIKAIDINK